MPFPNPCVLIPGFLPSRDSIELGPQLEALSIDMLRVAAQLSGSKRETLLRQAHGALFLLQPLFLMLSGQPGILSWPAVSSLAGGTGAMLAASAAVLSAPQQSGEEAEQLPA